VRTSQLTPYPHHPDVAGTVGGEALHEMVDMPDAAAEIVSVCMQSASDATVLAALSRLSCVRSSSSSSGSE
jgi:hypothetical protein